MRFFPPTAALYLMVGFSAFSLSGCNSNSNTPSAGAASNNSAIAVLPIRSIEQDTVDFEEYIGRTEASETVEVRARVSGFIKTVNFQEGTYVQENDLLFTIEPDQYQAVYDQAMSRIDLVNATAELAASKLARAKKLIDANAISQEEYDENVAADKESNAAIAAAKADAAVAALNLKYTEVRAPISGRIDRALITRGNMVNGGILDGSLLTRIVHNTPMFVYFDVDERSLLNYQRLLVQIVAESGITKNEIKNRQVPCYMQLQDETTFTHLGYLDFIENRADSDTGTIRVRAVFENQDQLLTGGLFVRVRIPKRRSSYKAVMIPEQAIVSDQTAKSVFVIGPDNVIERRSITLGSQKGELRVVQEGLKPGETIVMEGTQKVRPGVKITPTAKWEEMEANFYQKALAKQIKLVDAPPQTELPANPSPNSSPAEAAPVANPTSPNSGSN